MTIRTGRAVRRGKRYGDFGASESRAHAASARVGATVRGCRARGSSSVHSVARRRRRSSRGEWRGWSHGELGRYVAGRRRGGDGAGQGDRLAWLVVAPPCLGPHRAVSARPGHPIVPCRVSLSHL